MEAKGTQKHPSSTTANFSIPFKNPSLQCGSHRVIFQLPGDHQADAKNDHRITRPSDDRAKILIDMKQPSSDEKPECGQVSAAAAWKKGGGTPATNREGLKLRSNGTANGESSAMTASKSVGFSVRLTQDEITEDLIDMTGKKPPPRPKRQPKNNRKYLEGIFPGSKLPNNVVAGRY